MSGVSITILSPVLGFTALSGFVQPPVGERCLHVKVNSGFGIVAKGQYINTARIKGKHWGRMMTRLIQPF